MKRDTPLIVALAMTGLAALALEVLWSRAMIPWVGGTALSQITTVAIYMIGLFLGSALAVPALPRIADPRRAFVQVEAAAGALALVAVLGMPLVSPLLALFSRGELLGSGLGSVLRGLAGGGLMLPATVLMGFSFPLAIAALDRDRGARGSAALAYGVNTIGATLGTLIGGFVLVPWLGVKAGAIAVAIADLLVLAAVWRTRPPSTAAATVRSAAAPARAASAAVLATPERVRAPWLDELPMLVSILLGGMVSLGLEAVLFRVLGLLLGPTARAFTVVLAVYVLGLGVGSLLVRGLVQRSRRAAEVVYLCCWLLAGGYGLLVHTQTGQLSELVATGRAQEDFDLAGQLALRALVATLVLLPITCAFGASYSAAVAAAPRTDARRAGRLYAALTLGNILGLGVAAWGLLPSFRLDRALVVVLAAAFVVPIPALTATTVPRLARAAVALLFLAGGALAWLGMPRWPMRLLHTAAYAPDYKDADPTHSRAVVRFHRSAFETSVTVVQVGEDLFLQLDGKTTGSTTVDDQATQGLLGALPTALHPDPKTAFVIGLGTGHTPAEVLRFPVERVDCAEISPEVVLTMPLFEPINRRCDLDARFRMLEADGRTVLRYGGARYDLVISEPSNVWIPGVAHLFTKESFEDVRGCLDPQDGICAQWMQGYGLEVDTLRSIVRTFLHVFPHTSLWLSSLAVPDVFLVGSVQPLRVDAAALEQRLAAAKVANFNDGGRPMNAVSLLRHFIAGPETLARFAGAGPLTSDARPSLEYAAEVALITGSSDPARRLIAELCEPPTSILAAGPEGIDPVLVRELGERAEANRAINAVLAEIGARGGQASEAQLSALLALARARPRDRELVAAAVSTLAYAVQSAMVRTQQAGAPLPPSVLEFTRQVIALDPQHPEALKFAALLALSEGRHSEALARIERQAAAQQPWRVEPLLDRARVQLAMGRPADAVATLRGAVERNPWYQSAWELLATAHQQTGEAAAARRARERAAELPDLVPEEAR